jgi:hypothetical protein
MPPAAKTTPRCGAKTKRGTPCKQDAGWGTDHVGYGHCKLHLGSTRTGALHGAKLEAEAKALQLMGTPTHIEPEDALQFCIDVTHGEVAYCDTRIARLEEGEAATPIASERVHEELDRDGDVHELEERTTESTVQLHIWITTRQGAVDRLARYSKMALDAGIAERAVSLDERQGDLVAGAILAVIGRLSSLSADDRVRVPALLAEHVGTLTAAPAIEGSVA